MTPPPPSSRVLAIDPGERVGWAHGIASSDGLEVTGHGITGLKDFALKLHEVTGDYDVLVYETWRLRADRVRQFAGSDFPAVQFVGMIRLCAWLHPQVRLVSQGPDAKTTGAKVAPQSVREVLANLPKSHDDAHDGDALMHLSKYWFDHYV